MRNIHPNRLARDRIDDALVFVESLKGVERLIGCCDRLHDADAHALSCVLGQIREGLSRTLDQAFHSLDA